MDKIIAMESDFMNKIFGDKDSANEVVRTRVVDAFGVVRSIEQPKIDFVKSKYEHTIEGRKCLYFPAKNAKRVIISFGCANKDNKVSYFMWSWFWRDDEAWDDTAYLFIADPENTWYLGCGEKNYIDDFSRIITYFIKKSNVNRRHVITLGGSMGGYGALLYATLLGLGATVAFWPQVNQKDSPERAARMGKNWINLDAFINGYSELPLISLFFGTLPHDQMASYALIDVLKTKKIHVIFHHATLCKHNLFSILDIDKAYVNREIDYLDKQVVSLDAVKNDNIKD